MKWEMGTITVRGNEIKTKTGMFEHSGLKYYADNPRIYSTVHEDGQQLSQLEIQKKLWRMDHVKELRLDIINNGGLIDPVIVKSDSLEVIEGNSRLAAYRKLASADALQWGEMKCTFLPEGISESLVFSLLGQYHIKGKKDWSPYEQAGFLFRRYTQHEIGMIALGKELGIAKSQVSKLIKVYKTMVENDDNDVNRWSYYWEFLTSSKIKKIREEHAGLESEVLSQIKSGSIERATIIRDKLAKIPVNKKKIIKSIISKEATIEEAFERAEASGSTDALYNKIKRFRTWYGSPETEQALKKMSANTMQKVKYEIGKIDKSTKRMEKIIKDNTGS